MTESQLITTCFNHPALRTILNPEVASAIAGKSPVLCEATKFNGLGPTTEAIYARPVVTWSRQGCSDADYRPASPTLLDGWNARRQLEIEIRAVPRTCPTLREAFGWAYKVAT